MHPGFDDILRRLPEDAIERLGDPSRTSLAAFALGMRGVPEAATWWDSWAIPAYAAAVMLLVNMAMANTIASAVKLLE
jgi:hypothetical protein